MQASGKGSITMDFVPTPQVEWVSSSQQLPVEFAEDCCGALQMCSWGASVKTCQSFPWSLVHLKGIAEDKRRCELCNQTLAD